MDLLNKYRYSSINNQQYMEIHDGEESYFTNLHRSNNLTDIDLSKIEKNQTYRYKKKSENLFMPNKT